LQVRTLHSNSAKAKKKEGENDYSEPGPITSQTTQPMYIVDDSDDDNRFCKQSFQTPEECGAEFSDFQVKLCQNRN